MRKQLKTNFVNLLNENLRLNPHFEHLFKTVQKEIDRIVDEPLSQLNKAHLSKHIRRGDYVDTNNGRGKVAHIERVFVDDEAFDDITVQFSNTTITQRRRALQPRSVLINNSVLAGFNYYSDQLSDQDYAKINDYVTRYWPRSGTPEFIKFIGYVKDLNISIKQLWTIDKGDNATSDDPEISSYDWLEEYNSNYNPVWNGGDHYPTSHVELEYDAVESDNIDNDLVMLFYLLAPIHLVIQRLVGRIDYQVGYSLHAVGDIQQIDAGFVVV